MALSLVDDQATRGCLAAYGRCEEAIRTTGNLIHVLAEIASTGVQGSGLRPDLILEWEERCRQIADLWSDLLNEELIDAGH